MTRAIISFRFLVVNPGRDNEADTRKGNIMPTLKDVAREAGVSVATASVALRGGAAVTPRTTQKVRMAAERLGYRLNASARSLKSGRSGIISLIVPILSIPYYSKLATAFAGEIEANGMQTIIQQSDLFARHERQSIERIASAFSDGIIFDSTRLTAAEVARVAGGRPTILLEDFSGERLLDTVNTPVEEGMAIAVEHLLSRGCGRIGILGDIPDKGPDLPISRIGRKARYDAAIRAMASLVPEAAVHEWGPVDWTVDGGRGAAHALREAGMPYDGLVCMNDMMALGVLRGFNECAVRVPDDVKVIGFDGIDEGAYATPTLTTIAVDYAGMAQSAVALLRRRLDNPGDPLMPQRNTVGCRLVERESTRSGA